MIEQSAEVIDFTGLIAVSGLVLSIAGLLLGLFNSYVAWQNRKLALKQDARRAPALSCYLSQGFQRTGESGRLFSLLIQIRNPSDSNNNVAKAELVVRYIIEDRIPMAIKIPVKQDAIGILGGPKDAILSIPAKVQAHEVVSGWLHFLAPGDLLSGKLISQYELEITDTHGFKITVALNLIQEHRDEVGLA